MKNYDYQKNLHAIWEKAVEQYGGGNLDVSSYFDTEESEFIRSIGATDQEVFDFAEDYVTSGEPDFTTFALVHDIRRSYFLDVQNGKSTRKTIDPNELPAGNSEVLGLPWLLRIIEKAKAKLHGELHSDVMYSCGADRRFLKQFDIHPAEFLRQLWHNEENEGAIVDWVISRAGDRKAA